MKISYGRLMMLIALVVISIWAFGCSQKDDVTQPTLYATVTMEPQRLPTLDSLYIYELWMVKEDGGAESYTSLGKFIWDNYWSRFRNLAGDTISSVFEIPEPWLNYKRMMVTVENRDDLDPDSPSGTVILTTNVRVPDALNPVIQMHFPADFSKTTGNYFVSTPTRNTDFIIDANLNMVPGYDTAYDRRGLWIATRYIGSTGNLDTISLKYLGMDSTLAAITDADLNAPDSVGIANLDVIAPDSVLDDAVRVIKVSGYDTIWHYSVTQDIDWIIDTVPEWNYHPRYGNKNIDSVSDPLRFGPIKNERVVGVSFFTYGVGLTDFPDTILKSYGWRCNTWVLFSDPNPSMNLPKMSAFGYEGQHRFTGDTTWRVLPLGGFFRVDSADLSNHYIGNQEVPNFPGEDFLVGAGSFEEVNFMSGGASGMNSFSGSVIIGIEPDPERLNIDTTRNFPLFVLVDSLPSEARWKIDSVYTFHNYQNYLPTINVHIVFHK